MNWLSHLSALDPARSPKKQVYEVQLFFTVLQWLIPQRWLVQRRTGVLTI